MSTEVEKHSRPCIYCGNEVSLSTNGFCPACKKSDCWGIVCKFCGQIHKREDFSKSGPKFQYCQSCLAQYFTPPAGFVCPDCKAPIEATHDDVIDAYSNAGIFRCPRCGCRNVFAFDEMPCPFCKLPVASFHKARPVGKTGVRMHSFCTAPVEQKKGCSALVWVPIAGYLVWHLLK